MLTLAHLDATLARPVTEKRRMYQNVPGHWLVLAATTTISAAAGWAYNVNWAGVAGVIGLISVAVGGAMYSLITQSAKARLEAKKIDIEAQRLDLAFQRERSDVLKDTLAGQMATLAEQLKVSNEQSASKSELLRLMQARIEEQARQMLVQAGQMDEQTRMLQKITNDNGKVKEAVKYTVQKAKVNAAAIATIKSDVAAIQSKSDSNLNLPVVVVPVAEANEPTVPDMPTL